MPTHLKTKQPCAQVRAISLPKSQFPKQIVRSGRVYFKDSLNVRSQSSIGEPVPPNERDAIMSSSGSEGNLSEHLNEIGNEIKSRASQTKKRVGERGCNTVR